MGLEQSANSIDPFELSRLYKYLRTADVSDAMQGIGYGGIGLVSPDIRPLWPGIKFWGPALTIRCLPPHRPFWPLETTEEIVRSIGIWNQKVGSTSYADILRPGHVMVTDAGGGPEVGYWGSANGLAVVIDGAVGIVTNGYCRDTAECRLTKLPVCARWHGRASSPGRMVKLETQVRISVGGAQVRPGDIVGCDDDGVIVVPLEVAQEVAIHARAVLLHDMRGRRRLYERGGLTPDATVDCEAVEAYYSQFD